MDEKLQKELDFANFSTTLNNQKKMAKERFAEQTIYFTKGGQFTITKELINYCQTLVDNGQTSFILIDDNDVPIEIEYIDDFREEILNKYFNALNEYLAEYKKITSQRSIPDIVDEKEEDSKE